MAWTLRVTDEMIDNWRTTNSPDCRCPLAQALYAELTKRGTPVQLYNMLNAGSTTGHLAYKVGDRWYRLEPLEYWPTRNFIYTVDFQRDKRPRKHVFRYQDPKPIYQDWFQC